MAICGGFVMIHGYLLQLRPSPADVNVNSRTLE
jgi:hypothetical protein